MACVTAALVTLTTLCPAQSSRISLVLATNSAPRIRFGAERLASALKATGHEPAFLIAAAGTNRTVLIANIANAEGKSLLVNARFPAPASAPGQEGFELITATNGTIAVLGADDSGVLYGCLELAKRIRQFGGIPPSTQFRDAPTFVLRGPCIGMQKTYILPGRRVYEYPYTPELFPFFYDKQFWQDYLDFLVENRFNTLYLWNGHPFASLVKLPEYPYALEVSEDTFHKNQEMFRYIAQEADKRGIWLVQMFYSIILSKPFAEKNGISTQLAAPTPIAADYMRKSIAEFVREYPNVGLMVCLGEALQGLTNQVHWFTDTIAPGIKDGMKAAGLTAQPPVVLRTHATDATVVVPEALKVYTNLYTEAKFNGESLTTWEPRGVRQQLHQTMSKLGSTHLINVHILANLEPFRYGAQRFIQKCVIAARDRLGARGVHLYPLCYWNWPDSPDKTDPPLKQWKRDWIWFEAWARYSWNPDIPEAEDRAYWIRRLTEYYGNTNAAARILDAYNDAGECAPRLLRRFGITEGNRQTLSLGMTLDELVNPQKYSPFPELWESQSPPGERLQEYADKEWKHETHEGETPPQIIREARNFASSAESEINSAARWVTKNRDEFLRLRKDVEAIRLMSQFYYFKVQAAMDVLRYQHSKDMKDMVSARQYLADSVGEYWHLTKLTTDTYRFVNSMQTSQRKIPLPGGVNGVGTNYHWSHLQPYYLKEFSRFSEELARLRTADTNAGPATPASAPLRAAPFKLLSPNAETYTVQKGARVFTDGSSVINAIAPELDGLTGIRFSHEAAKTAVPLIEFEVSQPVRVLVGYFQSKERGWLQVPNLETAAHADDRGGLDAVFRNAVAIEGLPAVNVHAFRYEAGRHKLELIGQGSFLVLGIVPQDAGK